MANLYTKMKIFHFKDKIESLPEGINKIMAPVHIGSIKSCRFKEFWLLNKNKFFKINPSIHCNHHCVAHEKNRLVLDYLNTDKEHLVFV